MDVHVDAMRSFGFRRGCPVGTAAYALQPDQDAARAELRAIFDEMRDRLREFLSAEREAARLRPDADASRLATFCVAAVQGGLLLALVERRPEPVRSSIAEAFKHLQSYVRDHHERGSLPRVTDGPGGADAASARTAYRWLLGAVVLSLLAFGVGAAWDRAWHTRNPFEDFFSPPHLFIYTTHVLATMALAKIAFTAELRRHFGPPMRMPVFGEMPAALMLAGGGFGVIALAGLLDAIWHSTFGLDETAWSLPHSMLGSGILLSLLGFVSARLALSTDRPLTRWAPALFAVLLVGTMLGVLLGPLDNYRSLEHVRAVARIPILAATPEFQHTARIHEQWNLTRLNPLFIPLSALVIGMGLSFARRLVAAVWVFLLVALAATLLSGERGTAEYLGIANDLKNTAPVPYILPALTFAILAPTRLGEAWSWRIGGLVYGAAANALWPAGLAPLLAAAPAMALGAPLGDKIAEITRAPDTRVWRLLMLVGVVLPAVTGAMDLVLRSRTP